MEIANIGHETHLHCWFASFPQKWMNFTHFREDIIAIINENWLNFYVTLNLLPFVKFCVKFYKPFDFTNRENALWTMLHVWELLTYSIKGSKFE